MDEARRRLAGVLDRHREAVLDRWVQGVLHGPGVHYRERPADEVRRWMGVGLGALIRSLESGSMAPLIAHASELGPARERLGFAIEEVIDALLRLKGAVAPEIGAAVADRPPGMERAVAGALDDALRETVAAFGARFSAALRDREQRVAVLEERQRLARELHDSISQSMYAASMYAEAAHRLLGSGDAATAAAHAAEARDAAVQALREMRLMIYELRPGPLTELGLVETLRERLAAVERRAGVRASLEADSRQAAGLSAGVQEALYGVASEALNNALKHAGAGEVRVRVAVGADGAVLEVRDDGRGFEPVGAEGSGGLGMRGMRERLAAVGGRVDISSAPGRGTVVLARVPREGGGEGGA